MIRIRYAELPEGLHAQAKARSPRSTVIYLRPGLTPRQRRESLRRTLRSSRMGYGPPVSAAGLAVAVVADRLRTTLANAGAAVRWHPLGALLAAGMCATLMAGYAVLVSFSIHIVPAPVLQAVPPLAPLLRPIADLPALPDPARRRHAEPARSLASGLVSAPSPSGGPAPAPSPSSPSPSSGPSPSPSPSRPSPSPGPPSPSPSPSSSSCLIVGPIKVCL